MLLNVFFKLIKQWKKLLGGGGGGVKIEKLALIYKKCRGEGVKSEKSRKKTYFQCEV
jgi:hypothetical protein